MYLAYEMVVILDRIDLYTNVLLNMLWCIFTLIQITVLTWGKLPNRPTINSYFILQ